MGSEGGSARHPGRWLEIAAVALAYLGLALAATYPLVKFMNSRLIGSGDSAQFLWNLWWVREALQHGDGRLFYSSLIYYPDGVSLAYHTVSPFNGLLAFPFQVLLGMELTILYNSIVLLTFVGSGVSMYVLLRELVRSRMASFVGSLVFVFSPIRMSRVMYGNLGSFSTQFVPLMVWFLVRLRRKRRYRDAIGVAAYLALTAWCSLQTAMGSGLLVILVAAFDLFRADQRRQLSHYRKAQLKRWAVVAGLAGVLAFPVVWPLMRDATSFPGERNTLFASEYNSADLLGFLLPDYVTNPLVRRLVPRRIDEQFGRAFASYYGNPCEKSVSLGYTVMAMTLASVMLVRTRAVREWCFVAGFFIVLSLGPVLHVTGSPLIPLPYRLLNRIPFVGAGRIPSRQATYAMLALAVVVAYGLAALQRQWQGFAGVAALIGCLIFAEFLTAPVYLDRRVAAIPKYYHTLAADPRPGAILDVPMDLHGAQGPGGEYMLYQTVHGRPIVGGYISRTPPAALWPLERPFLNQLRARVYDDREPYAFSAEVMSHALDDLRVLDVRYVVLHAEFLSSGDHRAVRHALTEVISEPIHEDEELAVWYLE